ncbi:MAG: hypothetical protein ACOCXD_00600 [Bacteroidota bacterium]
MKTLDISKIRAKEFLAERLVFNILQTDEQELIKKFLYEPLGGFDKMDGKSLFHQLQEVFPEFSLIEYKGEDPKNIQVKVTGEHAASENDILVDIKRIIQMKL